MADARVQAAIRNWAGRFIVNGIDYNDFARTTAAVSRWEEWLDAWTVTAATHVAVARQSLAQGHRRSAGEAYVRAAVSYHFSKFVWVLDPALNRRNTEAAVRALYNAHELLDPTAERIEAPLSDGGAVVANLRRPAGTAPAPLVVLIPGLDSTKEEFFHWEQVFLDRGMATLSLDGPGRGRPASRSTSGLTTRSPSRRSLTPSPVVRSLTLSESGRLASASAVTTSCARRRSSLG